MKNILIVFFFILIGSCSKGPILSFEKNDTSIWKIEPFNDEYGYSSLTLKKPFDYIEQGFGIWKQQITISNKGDEDLIIKKIYSTRPVEFSGVEIIDYDNPNELPIIKPNESINITLVVSNENRISQDILIKPDISDNDKELLEKGFFQRPVDFKTSFITNIEKEGYMDIMGWSGIVYFSGFIEKNQDENYQKELNEYAENKLRELDIPSECKVSSKLKDAYNMGVNFSGTVGKNCTQMILQLNLPEYGRECFCKGFNSKN